MENTQIEYILTWFHKAGDDFLVDNCVLQHASLNGLLELFDLLPLEERIVDCYPVRHEHIEYLQRFTNHKIDFDKYDYFVEGQQREKADLKSL